MLMQVLLTTEAGGIHDKIIYSLFNTDYLDVYEYQRAVN